MKKQSVLMIDNYDSFTYNLVQYLSELGANVAVFRNDAINLEKIGRLAPQKIVISPGPGTPDDAGISSELIEKMSGKIPILGVCLGHQCIGQVYGGKIVRARHIMHGKISDIYHERSNLFRGLKNPFQATRYHSLLIERRGFPHKELNITARTKAGEIMGVEHKKHPTFGVQFHPESIMTAEGKKLLKNFLDL